MSMHTELITINKREWQNMVDKLQENHELLEKITKLLDQALRANGYKAVVMGSCIDDCPNS